MSKFITELSADEYGNRLYTNSQPCVVEIEPINEYSSRVLAPEWFRSRWPTIAYHGPHLRGWKEVEGPARLLSEDEYRTLIEGATP